MATCKLNDVNPAAYIAETLQAISTAILRAVSRSLCHGTSGKRQVPTHRVSARRLQLESLLKCYGLGLTAQESSVRLSWRPIDA
ncbi:transposase domain-containing protein [Mesorhizobium sp.]|uniref:transposase domain-containing protein n=1 Tax=Mesorhizobium sp. TaxID=1871066 RepID=UPI0025F0B046|nr:transposase domain-containing protein [Mesorhizobium sp.]